MLKIAFKSLLARKLRLALMLFAIVIGVTWIVGTLIVTASLSATFDNLVQDIEGQVDLTVRTTQEFGEEANRPPVSESLLPTLRAIPGVRAAGGKITAFNTVPIKADGVPVKTQGPPMFGVNYGEDDQLSQLVQIDGRRPEGPSEFNMDIDSAKDNGFIVGDSYKVSTSSGTREFKLVGTVGFNSVNNDTVGAVLSVFDTKTAQELFGLPGQFNEIAVAVAPGADVAQVQAAIATALPKGAEVVDRAVKVDEGQKSFGQISSIFGNVLLGFGVIIVIVVAFLINNTFRIVIGQRLRELALLRAIGATGRQVVQAVIGEALLLGITATALGFVLGIGFAKGFQKILKAIGFGLPSSPLKITPGTVVAAAIVGVGVTLLSALLPVLKVRSIPPVAALRDDFHLEGAGLRRRIITGGLVTAIGAVLLIWGLFGGLDTAPLLTLLAIGALLIFVGVNLLSPVFAVPVANLLGAPIARLRGTAGRLARDNAARNPARTASTAAALMIGLALISMTAIIGASIKQTFLSTLDNAVEADYFVRVDSSRPDPTQGFSPALTEKLRALPELSSVLAYRFTMKGVKISGSVKDINGTDFTELPAHIDLGVISGDIATASPNSILVHKDSAKDLGLKVGSPVEVTFVDGSMETLTVAAIYDDSSILGNWVISLDTWDRHFARDSDQFVTAVLAPNVTPAAATRAIDTVLADYPQVKAEDRTAFKKSQEKQLDSFLAVITGFLGLSFIIALIGIFNTLQLSVFERTRELGLLRAVGMTRRQLRSMVRWEAVIVALFGAALGILLGVVFGFAVASAIPSSVIKTVSVPVGSLIGYAIVAALGGLLAALWPAWRASKLNVLDAIAQA